MPTRLRLVVVELIEERSVDINYLDQPGLNAQLMVLLRDLVGPSLILLRDLIGDEKQPAVFGSAPPSGSWTGSGTTSNAAALPLSS